MTVAEWCLLGAVVLYLLTIAPIKAMGRRDFDNADPRAEAFYRNGLRKRALGAHMNGIETYPFFATAVLLAEMRLAPQGLVDGLALAFLVTRALFVVAYLGDRPSLRSLLWSLGFAVNVALFTTPLWAN